MNKPKLSLLADSPLVIWSFITLLIVSAYFPSLTGPLVFDDQLNITENPDVAIHDLSYQSLKTALMSNDSGQLKRVLPALSFGINHYFAGGFTHTFVFKVTNLVIHLLNSALVFWLAYLLWPKFFIGAQLHEKNTKRLTITAAAVALVWALHPIQVTTVAYVVQRMTSMAGTFMFLGLCIFVVGRLRLERGISNGLIWMWAGVIGGTVLGLLCKENAALLPLYAGVIEFTLFSGVIGPEQPSAGQEKTRRNLTVFYLLTLVLPVLAALIYWFVYPGGVLDGFAGRTFSLAERLLTEARVLWFYLYMLFVPDITVMGLFHDDLSISKDWLTPWTTVFAVLAWIIVALLAVLLRKQVPAFSFAVLWYLAGHSMESTFIPLQIIFEHRNYVPSFGPIMLAVFGVLFLLDQVRLKSRVLPFLYGALGLIGVAGLYYGTLSNAENWRTENGFIASIAKNHPLSPSSQYLYGEVLYKKLKDPFQAYPYYYRAAQLEPDEAGFLVSVAMVTPADVFPSLKQSQKAELIDPQHIADLLKNKPVSAWGLRALDVAGRCVKAKHISCSDHLAMVRDWMKALIANKGMDISQKRHFINELFDIEMQNGLFNEALKTITDAKAADTGFSRFYLMHADALAALGYLPQAVLVLDEAERKFAQNDPKLKADVERLRRGVLNMAAGKNTMSGVSTLIK